MVIDNTVSEVLYEICSAPITTSINANADILKDYVCQCVKREVIKAIADKFDSTLKFNKQERTEPETDIELSDDIKVFLDGFKVIEKGVKAK